MTSLACFLAIPSYSNEKPIQPCRSDQQTTLSTPQRLGRRHQSIVHLSDCESIVPSTRASSLLTCGLESSTDKHLSLMDRRSFRQKDMINSCCITDRRGLGLKNEEFIFNMEQLMIGSPPQIEYITVNLNKMNEFIYIVYRPHTQPHTMLPFTYPPYTYSST